MFQAASYKRRWPTANGYSFRETRRSRVDQYSRTLISAASAAVPRRRKTIDGDYAFAA